MLKLMLNFPQWFMGWVMPIRTIEPLTIMAIGSAAAGAGSLMGGVGGLMGGDSDRPQRHWTETDWYRWSKAIAQQSRAQLMNTIEKKKFEGFPGAANIRTQIGGFTRQMMEEPPPDYAAGIEKRYAPKEGEAFKAIPTDAAGKALAEERKPYAPQVDMMKDEKDMTEWDKMAVKEGILVTKWNDFETKEELQAELWRKNWSAVNVDYAEIKIWEAIVGGILGVNIFQGEFDQIVADVIRTLKAFTMTNNQFGGSLDLNQLIENIFLT